MLDRLTHDASFREQVAFMLAGHATGNGTNSTTVITPQGKP